MKTKVLKLTLALFGALFIATSCSKSDDPAPTPTPTPVTYDVKGYYKGTTGASTSIVLLIEDTGKFTIVDGANFYSTSTANIGYGTSYTFTNNVFTGTFKLNLGGGSQYTLTATYNPTTGAFTSGSIGSGTSTTGVATFTAQRTINSNSNAVGLWYGKYNTTPSNTTTFTSPYTMLVEDATHVVIADAASISGNSNLGYGTFTVAGTAFSCTYKYNFGAGTQFSNIATFDTTNAKLTPGTWGSGTNISGSGNWYMDKLK